MCAQNDIIISKLYIKDMKPVFIKVQWENNKSSLFDMLIFYEEKCWSGKFLQDTAKQIYDRLEESQEKYLKDVKNCLMKQDRMFKYDFSTNSDGSATFCWKKMFEDSTAVFMHGSINAFPDTSINKDRLIDILLCKIETLESTVKEYKKENTDITNDLEKCKTEFDKFVDLKSSLESNLYGKFVQLLNSKKRRIQILEDHLQLAEP